ncbi:MAG: methyltransferase domain-containing protein [Candidatus Aminicenantes bacterium]|nr:methyltransferase domain-containing protein [Candidatus Aminicenantes bacterium]
MGKVSDTLFVRRRHVCPRWFCFTFDNAFRKLIHRPARLIFPYIKPGGTALDIGAGIGYFTIPMARAVGSSGRVIAADVQSAMLSAIERRARRAGLSGRVRTHLSEPDSLGIIEAVDFALAFWVIHEVPEPAKLLGEICAALRPGGFFLLVEPRLHVSLAQFEELIAAARAAGFSLRDRPKVALSRAALLARTGA